MKINLRSKANRAFKAARLGLILSTGLLAFGNADAQYCASSFSSTTFEHITNVTFGSINNTTGGITGLNNYTALSTQVAPGGAYPISISILPDANEYIYVFIDWNQNGTLNDAGEVYTVAMATSLPGPHTMTINVPGAATVGSTRMRVMCDYAGTTPDPCRVATWGEVEDYTVIVSAVPNDAGVASIDSPAGGCAGMYNVVATIKNFGTNQVNPVTIGWSFNGNVMTSIQHTSVLDTLGGQGSQSVQLNLGSVTLTAGGMDTIMVWTEMPNNVNDSNHLNDTLMKIYTVLPVVSTFPYYEDFEAGQADWQVVGSNPSWAFGTPAKSNISGASSGINAFVTGGLSTSSYNPNEDSQVNSPCFDMTNFEGTPWVALDVNWYSEGSYDGAALQTSVDDGKTWQTVGAVGDPNNWYTDNSLDSRAGGSSDGWAGTGTSSSNGWKRAKHVLPMSLAGKQVRFRIAFGSDGSVQYDGFSFDNFTVVDFKEADLGPDKRSLCLKPSVTLDPNVNFNGTIAWSTGDSINETIQVTSPGIYSVVYTDSLIDESTTDQIEIIQTNPPVIAFASLIDTIRVVENITLDPKLPYDLDYNWMPDNLSYPYLLLKGSVLGVGVHQKTLMVTDSVLCTDQKTVTIVVTSIDGIEGSADSRIDVFPNPVSDLLNISLVNQNFDRADIRLFDVNGQMVYSNVHAIDGNMNIQMDLSNLKSGTYVLQIVNGEKREMRKIIKQ